MSKVSIIVPIYNTEKYLRRCIESIINQTYRNIEVILINDGSTDGSANICDEFMLKDNRISVIHKKNSGVSFCRNRGIKLSIGDYLQFVDSDDYLDIDMTENLVKSIEANDADLVICGYKRIEDLTNSQILRSFAVEERVLGLDGFKQIYDGLYDSYYLNSPCNKLYRAKIIKDNGILFNTNMDLGEDLLFNVDVFKKSASFVISSSCPYNYVVYNTKDTLSSKFRTNHYEIEKSLLNNLMSMYTQNDQILYAKQLRNLKRTYSKELINSLKVITDLKTARDSFMEIKEICNDSVLTSVLDELNFATLQEQLFKMFIKYRLYITILLFIKVKLLIRRRLPKLFRLLKSFGGK